MSQSSSLKSDAASAFTLLPEFVEAKAEFAEVNQSFKTKLVSFRSFIRKTTTCKDEVRASIRCVGRCIDKIESRLNNHTAIVHERVDRPVVSSSEDLSQDQLRSNATLLLKYFKKHTLKSHLEICESLIDAVMIEAHDCITSSEDEDTGYIFF
ncbi:hypothetical protein Bca52824_091518 [Brassica carinata]|uniref:Uncharacterized protein n=1 Tax=Brassica carinata TaxID=52824 RepID=A0A8X7NXH4_BRACI|nr:hypothetical protein Bca52824_091518 [Brassica carinata]